MRIYGKNTVIERLRANPQSFRKIHIEHGFTDASEIYKRAKKHNIPVMVVQSSRMDRIARNKNMQGIVADVCDFEYADYDDLLKQCIEKNRCPVFLDSLQDPQNLGAIIRSLGCLGRFAIIIPTHDSASVTETVLKIACGGENYVPIALVANINKALRKAKDADFWIVGSVVEGGTNMDEFQWPHPIALVVGSERGGIRDVILKNLDFQISVPMYVDTMSLNAAAAATVICYEIARHKRLHNKSRQP